MEITCEITPEMLGLTWRRVLLHALLTSVPLLLGGFVVSAVFHTRVGAVLSAVASCIITAFLLRPISRSRLRVTSDSIEELDGPTIRRDEIACVTEHIGSDYSGLEIVGGKPRWLRKYRILVPAALPQYEEIKQVVQSWASTQQRDRG